MHPNSDTNVLSTNHSTKPVGPGGEMKFRTASGGKMRHYGSRMANFTARDGEKERLMGKKETLLLFKYVFNLCVIQQV